MRGNETYRESYRTPVPREDLSKGSGSGPVTTYQLSQDEWDRYKAQPVQNMTKASRQYLLPGVGKGR